MDKYREQLRILDDKIDKKRSEMSELEEKRKSIEEKLLSNAMTINNLKVTDVVDMINAAGKKAIKNNDESVNETEVNTAASGVHYENETYKIV